MTDMATVAKNLRDIEDMALRLEARAEDQGRRVASEGDRGIPGGDAMVNLASVGSLSDWLRRVDIAEATWGNGNVDLSTEDPDQSWPAIQVLWFWSESFRLQLGHDHDDPRWRPTLISEAKFLRNHDVAEWIWNNEVHWDDYASDVAQAKSKLENILIEGDRSERTPVICDRCDDGRPLVRVYDEAEVTGWTCTYGEDVMPLDVGEEPCPVCAKPAPHNPVMESDPDADRWKCMGCKHQFTLEELDDARATQMRRSEPREWVSRAEAIDLLRSMGHQGRTAASLVDQPEALGWKDEVSRIRYVSWPDVWRSHLLALQAARNRLEDAARAKAHKEMCEQNHDDDCWITGRGCSSVCPRGSSCEWFLCPVHATTDRVSA